MYRPGTIVEFGCAVRRAPALNDFRPVVSDPAFHVLPHGDDTPAGEEAKPDGDKTKWDTPNRTRDHHLSDPRWNIRQF